MAKSKETICIHNNRNDDGVNTPIFTSTANKYIGYDDNVYPRYFNTENQEVIVDTLCQLENAEAGMIFSSGMAAISTAMLGNLKSGDHAIVSDEIYGGTHMLIMQEFSKFGIEVDFVKGDNVNAYTEKIRSNTKLIYTETPSNPLLTIVDLKAIASVAKANGIITLVDNTFATPINQNPIELGIDVVIHSGTKYLGGHSDLCFGAVLTSKSLKNKMYKSALSFGGSLNALDCYLIERSLKTLSVRVEKHNTNAQKVAEFLKEHDLVKSVFYPGLKNHLNHEIAATQMKNGFGGMMAFELVDAQLTDRFMENLKLVTPTLSLGGVETILCQPSKTSHVKMPEEERLKLGITDGMLRLSVGIENPQEIIDDLKMAMEKAAQFVGV